MAGWITEIEQAERQSNILTEDRFRTLFKYEERERQSYFRIVQEKFQCSKTIIFELFPVLKWLPNYDFRNSILNDILVAVITTPLVLQIQLGYAHMAKLPLVAGLYASILPPIIYFLMGTSRHVAVGMGALVSMMIEDVIAKYNNNHQSPNQEYSPLQIALATTFLSGLWLLILGVFKVGSLCNLLSDSFMSAFYIAGSVHVIFNRLRSLLGIEYPDSYYLFGIFYDCFELFKRITDINFITFGLSAFVIIGFYVFNAYAKSILASKVPKSKLFLVLKVLIVVFAGMLSYFLDLHDKYNVEIIGDIPYGLPKAVMPPFKMLPKLIWDSFLLSVTAIPIYLPVTKRIAKKHDYKIKQNQELLAYGVCNVISCFFSCTITGNSIDRTIIQDLVGARSQFTNLFTAIFVIFILLFLEPIFKFIPVSVLSAIITVHSMQMLTGIKELPSIYRKSKPDAAVWIVTFSATLILDLNYGIIIGIIACAMEALIPTQKTKVIVLGRVPGTSIFLDTKYFKSAVILERTIILKIIGNVHFANAESIQEKILCLVKVYEKNSLRFVILNLAAVGYMDPTGVKSLISVADELKKMELTLKLFLTDCLPHVYKILTDCNFFEMLPKNHVFASVKDAVEYSKYDEGMKGVEATF